MADPRIEEANVALQAASAGKWWGLLAALRALLSLAAEIDEFLRERREPETLYVEREDR